MIEIIDTKKPPALDLRRSYLDSLPEPQEFYVENCIAGARTFLIRVDGQAGGYAVVDGDKRLLEFFVEDSLRGEVSTLFNQVIQAAGVREVLCKSFDRALLDVCGALPATREAGGFLYRKIVDRSFVARADITVRPAAVSDIDSLLAINDGFFDDAAEVKSYMTADARLFLFHDADQNLVGCGIAKRVIPGRDDFDVGMFVNPAHRRKGYAGYILGYLKDYFLSQGLRPIAGCHPDNVGSQRSLQNAGFASEHRGLIFKL
ncbi:MAG: GNAT family N-acetyltransferase [Alphaproteobacteria bacterium]|nr:GNAT family N-acetyltransferase [Alphaproteobacteria bacterium]